MEIEQSIEIETRVIKLENEVKELWSFLFKKSEEFLNILNKDLEEVIEWSKENNEIYKKNYEKIEQAIQMFEKIIQLLENIDRKRMT